MQAHFIVRIIKPSHINSPHHPPFFPPHQKKKEEEKKQNKTKSKHKAVVFQINTVYISNYTWNFKCNEKQFYFHTRSSFIFLCPIGLPPSSSTAVKASRRDSNTKVAEPLGFPLWSYCSDTDPGIIRYP